MVKSGEMLNAWVKGLDYTIYYINSDQASGLSIMIKHLVYQ